jgi:hypothetical protein
MTTDTIIQNYKFHHYYNYVYMNKTIRFKKRAAALPYVNICVCLFCVMLTKFQCIINLKKLLQVGILTFYKASVSSPFNRSPWLALLQIF